MTQQSTTKKRPNALKRFFLRRAESIDQSYIELHHKQLEELEHTSPHYDDIDPAELKAQIDKNLEAAKDAARAKKGLFKTPRGRLAERQLLKYGNGGIHPSINIHKHYGAGPSWNREAQIKFLKGDLLRRENRIAAREAKYDF